MSRPIWLVNLLKKSFPQRFRFARLTRLPLVGMLIDQSLFAGDEMVYLPSDRSITINESIRQPENVVLPSQLVEDVIRSATHHWIMDFCLCRAGNDCEEYPQEFGCIFLGEAVQGINTRLGRRVTAEEAVAHSRRGCEAGLMPLIGRSRIDSLWLGTGPGDKLLTICHCCPCCCVFKTLPDFTPRIASKISRLQGVDVRVNELCIGCGTCAGGACFVDAIRLVDGFAEISPECRGCGRCVEVCPNEAITLTYAGNGTYESAFQRMSEIVEFHS